MAIDKKLRSETNFPNDMQCRIAIGTSDFVSTLKNSGDRVKSSVASQLERGNNGDFHWGSKFPWNWGNLVIWVRVLLVVAANASIILLQDSEAQTSKYYAKIHTERNHVCKDYPKRKQHFCKSRWVHSKRIQDTIKRINTKGSVRWKYLFLTPAESDTFARVQIKDE